MIPFTPGQQQALQVAIEYETAWCNLRAIVPDEFDFEIASREAGRRAQWFRDSGSTRNSYILGIESVLCDVAAGRFP